MNVYTYFDPNGSDLEAQLVPLWEESWRRQGWTPRVLTIRDARKHSDFDERKAPPLFAWERAGGGWFSPVHTINFSLRPKTPRAKIEFFNGGILWATKRGARDLLINPGLKRDLGKDLVSVFEWDTPKLPLVSFQHCKSVEEVQRGIDSCLQVRKKN